MPSYDIEDDDFIQMMLAGIVARVETYTDPINVIVLVYADGRRVTLTAADDRLLIGEENLPTC